MRKWSKVTNFNPNSQDPDPPRQQHTDRGMRISGPGSISGGSKPTPQVSRMHSGNGKLSGSYPRSPQKLRG